jgi:hypothetical protein
MVGGAIAGATQDEVQQEQLRAELLTGHLVLRATADMAPAEMEGVISNLRVIFSDPPRFSTLHLLYSLVVNRAPPQRQTVAWHGRAGDGLPRAMGGALSHPSAQTFS